MTKREAKIFALEAMGNSADIVIDLYQFQLEDIDKINTAFDEVSTELLNRAKRLKSNNKTKENERIRKNTISPNRD